MLPFRLLIPVLGFAAATLLPIPGARAATATLGASQDNTIFASNASNSNGGGPGIFAGSNGAASPRRGLIEFSIAGSVPAGATITGVTFSLTVGQVPNATQRTVGLFALSKDWGEGTAGASISIGGTGSGAAAATGDATWSSNHFNISTWTAAGGDFNGTASATTTVANVALNTVFTWSSATMISDVQGWLNNPATNFGWEIINSAEGTSQSVVGFYSREGQQVSGVTAGELPTLIVTYAVPEPSTVAAICLGIAAVAATIRRRRLFI